MASGRTWLSAIATALVVVGAAFAVYGLIMMNYAPFTAPSGLPYWNNYSYSFWGGIIGIIVGAGAGLWAAFAMRVTHVAREELAQHIPA